jgi:putative Mg2+ transporter-C (MgtC) family protein
MPMTLTWSEIALRLALAFAAGAVIGFNRSERGRTAGLRTTILVCMAACIAMLQANLLLGTAGKRPDSFVVLDLMRLPLGILTGMGFIGAGAILRKGNLLLGVTTAATLWFVTVIGLCFGGGQLALGAVGTAVGIFVLWVLNWVELWLPMDRQGTLALTTLAGTPSEQEIRAKLAAQRCRIISTAQRIAEQDTRRVLTFQVRWQASATDTQTPRFVEDLAQHAGVLALEWRP